MVQACNLLIYTCVGSNSSNCMISYVLAYLFSFTISSLPLALRTSSCWGYGVTLVGVEFDYLSGVVEMLFGFFKLSYLSADRVGVISNSKSVFTDDPGFTKSCSV